jgi:lysophospholipase L1-like esterase
MSKAAGIVPTSLLLCLLTLELGMRLFGFAILRAQDVGNEIRPGDSRALRIVAIGESTTSDWFGPGNTAWPRQLERQLVAAGIPARVYNLGMVGTTTDAILERLPEQLDRFRPDIAITMMGINDGNTTLRGDPNSAWTRLRVVQLYRLLRRKYAEMKTQRESDPNVAPPVGEEALALDKLRTLLLSQKPAQAMPLLAETANKFDADKRAVFYQVMADSLPQDGVMPQIGIRIDLLRRSLAARFQIEPASSLATLLAFNHREDECLALAQEIVRRGWILGEQGRFGFLKCADLSLLTASRRQGEWPPLLESLAGIGFRTQLGVRYANTKDNYQELHRQLASRKIIHIAMQYPTQDVSTLKGYFSGDAEARDIDFVENRSNFSDALAQHRYDEIFADRFANQWGHTTPLGHSLLAQSAFVAVTRNLHPAQTGR